MLAFSFTQVPAYWALDVAKPIGTLLSSSWDLSIALPQLPKVHSLLRGLWHT